MNDFTREIFDVPHDSETPLTADWWQMETDEEIQKGMTEGFEEIFKGNRDERL